MKIKVILVRVLDILIGLFLVGLVIFVCSCEDRLENRYQYFTIPSGSHASLIPKTQSLQSKNLRFAAIFDASAMYSTDEKSNQHDINKLVGFADCNSHHHDHSARFGWRWLEGKLEIHAYVYASGQRHSKLIGEVKLDKSYEYEIVLEDDHYVFYLEGFDPVSMKRDKPCSRGFYYMLFPYFGGDEKAPHEMTIQIMFRY